MQQHIVCKCTDLEALMHCRRCTDEDATFRAFSAFPSPHREAEVKGVISSQNHSRFRGPWKLLSPNRIGGSTIKCQISMTNFSYKMGGGRCGSFPFLGRGCETNKLVPEDRTREHSKRNVFGTVLSLASSVPSNDEYHDFILLQKQGAFVLFRMSGELTNLSVSRMSDTNMFVEVLSGS
jgi:hypothetical protein